MSSRRGAFQLHEAPVVFSSLGMSEYLHRRAGIFGFPGPSEETDHGVIFTSLYNSFTGELQES